MCDDEMIDVWTICHVAVSTVIGFFSRVQCIRQRWVVCVGLLVVWELFEMMGRKLHWTWIRAWFECESELNVAADIAVGIAGVAFGMALHKRMTEC